MGAVARIQPPDLESPFHTYDRALRLNLALRRVHGPLDTDAKRAPTGAPLAVLNDENARMKSALEKRGIPVPRVSEGSVQPTSLLEPPRWHVAADDPGVCPCCGARTSRRKCDCGYIRSGSPAPRPGWWYRNVKSRLDGRTTLPDPGAPFRPTVRWDYLLAWTAGVPALVVVLAWLLQPVLR